MGAFINDVTQKKINFLDPPSPLCHIILYGSVTYVPPKTLDVIYERPQRS